MAGGQRRQRGEPLVTGQRRALVTDADRGSALAIIRSLARRGWRVTAAAADRWAPGFYSRHAADRLRYPSPDRDPDGAIAAILGGCERRGIDLLIPVTDEVILPLAAWPGGLPGGTIVALADRAALEVAWDKQATLELADRLGVPTPRTVAVRTVAEAVEAARQLGWPIVLKPRRSRRYVPGQPTERFSVAYAADVEQVARLAGGLVERTDLLVQEYCPGGGQGIELLLDHGLPLAGFQHRRLREVPVTGGASAYRESVPLDAELLDLSVRLLAALRWTGLAMVEFRGTADRPRLMEINGRVWGSLPLAVLSGMDFPAKLADLVTGHPRAEAMERTYRVGVRAHNLALEVSWIGSVLAGRRRRSQAGLPGRRAAFAAAASLLRPGDCFDIATWDDPRPGLAELAMIGRRLVGRLARPVGA